MQRRYSLSLPATIDPRIRAQAAEFAAGAASNDEIIDRAVAWFSSKGFSYTLEPGEMGPNATATFLFDRRKGYCAHYAGALCVLMRAAGGDDGRRTESQAPERVEPVLSSFAAAPGPAGAPKQVLAEFVDFIIPIEAPEEVVDGMVFMGLSPYELEVLDRYEEVDSGMYRRHLVDVEAWGCGPQSVRLQAHTYVGGPRLPGVNPERTGTQH